MPYPYQHPGNQITQFSYKIPILAHEKYALSSPDVEAHFHCALIPSTIESLSHPDIVPFFNALSSQKTALKPAMVAHSHSHGLPARFTIESFFIRSTIESLSYSAIEPFFNILC